MKAVAEDTFLPRVNNCPRVVMLSAVARGMQGHYAGLLKEPMPDNLTALIGRMNARSERQG
jgi:hypothetical protein